MLTSRRSTRGQKAPSAIRCIKTGVLLSCCVVWFLLVRKHRAPKGALRLAGGDHDAAFGCCVRKHRAPKGALRLVPCAHCCFLLGGVRKHRAPKGALRLNDDSSAVMAPLVRKHRAPKGALRPRTPPAPTPRPQAVRKHRAPKGALRPGTLDMRSDCICESESTERQKVH